MCDQKGTIGVESIFGRPPTSQLLLIRSVVGTCVEDVGLRMLARKVNTYKAELLEQTELVWIRNLIPPLRPTVPPMSSEHLKERSG